MPLLKRLRHREATLQDELSLATTASLDGGGSAMHDADTTFRSGIESVKILEEVTAPLTIFRNCSFELLELPDHDRGERSSGLIY